MIDHINCISKSVVPISMPFKKALLKKKCDTLLTCGFIAATTRARKLSQLLSASEHVILYC